MNDVLWKESYGLYLYPHIRPKNYIMKIIGLNLYVNIRMNNVGSFSLFLYSHIQYIQHICENRCQLLM